MQSRINFASDNHTGVHPQILSALARVNSGVEHSYGNDTVTAELAELMQNIFGQDTHTFPVLTGTGANVLAISGLSPRWGGVICAESAHINVDENGAPERLAGVKLLPLEASDGKLTPELIESQLWALGNEHHAQPAVVSITQSTETGRCYTPGELVELVDCAHSHGLKVHMDGSRLANAAAALQSDIAVVSRAAGIDALSLGGTKNGLLAAEAVLVWDEELAVGLKYIRKYLGQLVSKMRFISAQLLELYGTDLWHENAHRANDMARLFAEKLSRIPAVKLTQEQTVNVVFAQLDPAVAQRLRERFDFHPWLGPNEVRLMTSYETTEQEIDLFCTELLNAVNEIG